MVDPNEPQTFQYLELFSLLIINGFLGHLTYNVDVDFDGCLDIHKHSVYQGQFKDEPKVFNWNVGHFSFGSGILLLFNICSLQGASSLENRKHSNKRLVRFESSENSSIV